MPASQDAARAVLLSCAAVAAAVAADRVAAAKTLAYKYSRRDSDSLKKLHHQHPTAHIQHTTCIHVRHLHSIQHNRPQRRQQSCGRVLRLDRCSSHTFWLPASATLDAPRLLRALSSVGPTDARISAEPTATDLPGAAPAKHTDCHCQSPVACTVSLAVSTDRTRHPWIGVQVLTGIGQLSATLKQQVSTCMMCLDSVVLDGPMCSLVSIPSCRAGRHTLHHPACARWPAPIQSPPPPALRVPSFCGTAALPCTAP